MSLSNWPPGLLMLAHIIPKLAFPPILVLVVHQYSFCELPNFIWFLAYLLVTPSIHIASRILRHFQDEAEMKRLGARKVPQVHSSWPGGLDLVWVTVKSFTDGYPGTLSLVFTITLSGMCPISRPVE